MYTSHLTTDSQKLYWEIMKNQIEKQVYDCINDAIVQAGYEIVEVEFVKPSSVLTIFIDKEGGGISLDDCERVNNIVDPLLDQLDPTDGNPYTLNVSSPGLDRKFVTNRDYERNYNREVEVKLKKQYKKKFCIEGILLNKTQQSLILQVDDQQIVLDMDNIQFVRPAIKFK